MSKNYCCIDCGGLVGSVTALHGSGRCRTCAGIVHSQKMSGENNPSYKDGHYIQENLCIDCKQPIGPNAERCGSCASTFRNLNGGGNFKGGHTLNRKCIECGNPITKQANKCEDCDRIERINRLSEIAKLRKVTEFPNIIEKECNHCNKVLSISSFYIHGKDRFYYQANCKECCSLIHKEYLQLHRDQINKKASEWYKKTGKRNFYLSTWPILRLEIYKRDNWTCQECEVHCTNKGPTCIQCHHIDYNTTNNLSINLITLCARCHCQTNFNREKWQIYFEKKIEEMIKNLESKMLEPIER